MQVAVYRFVDEIKGMGKGKANCVCFKPSFRSMGKPDHVEPAPKSRFLSLAVMSSCALDPSAA